ncbi:MAG: hypothetical protein RL322_540 [Pseudomonadota bacterium]|jgi:uncharacterized coiled-coil protein SlyX
MAIPWLAALQLVPWSQVIEHAPKVLAKAQEFLKRRGTGASTELDPADGRSGRVEAAELDPVRLDHRIRALESQLALQRQQLDQVAQMLGELAEQNASLIAAVHLLRRRSRWLQVALFCIVVAGFVTWIRLG